MAEKCEEKAEQMPGWDELMLNATPVISVISENRREPFRASGISVRG